MGSSLEPRTTKIPAYQNSDFITGVCTAAVTTLLCRTARDICILPSAPHNKMEPMNCTAPHHGRFIGRHQEPWNQFINPTLFCDLSSTSLWQFPPLWTPLTLVCTFSCPPDLLLVTAHTGRCWRAGTTQLS